MHSVKLKKKIPEQLWTLMMITYFLLFWVLTLKKTKTKQNLSICYLDEYNEYNNKFYDVNVYMQIHQWWTASVTFNDKEEILC